MVDFGAMLAGAHEEEPIEPRDVHSQLKKSGGYGYLRDVQAQVLTAPLVGSACSLSSGPIVAFNALSNDWERPEHTGLATLMKGLFGTFRNTTAHAPKLIWAPSRSDVFDTLTLASVPRGDL